MCVYILPSRIYTVLIRADDDNQSQRDTKKNKNKNKIKMMIIMARENVENKEKQHCVKRKKRIC